MAEIIMDDDELSGRAAAFTQEMIKMAENGVLKHILKTGDMYFIPRAYPHHIKNITTRFLVFFDRLAPGDIGLTGSFSAYSRETIAATLQCSIKDLPQYPFYPESLLIVKRINPIDP
ncbi:hypothetical protein I4U23_011879 [Adineta vaga]|nr:hypothetical protein I4U23_011879 [Adineta vaga]